MSLLRIFIAMALVAAHVVAIGMFEHGIRKRPLPSASSVMVIELLSDRSAEMVPSVSEPILDNPSLSLAPPPDFGMDPEPPGDRGVHTISLPQVDVTAPVDVSMYATSAGLSSGQHVYVVLLVEVLNDGSVGDVQVRASGGNSTIDAAALKYARALHWRAGTLDGNPASMRALLGVNLRGADPSP